MGLYRSSFGFMGKRSFSVLKSASHPAVLLVVRPRLRHRKERALRRVRLNGKASRDYGFKALPNDTFAPSTQLTATGTWPESDRVYFHL